MRATTDNLVSILDELGLLDLDGGRGEALGPDEDAFPFDLDAERRGEDLRLRHDVSEEAGMTADIVAPDPSARAETRRQASLDRIAGDVGRGSPPPLEGPDAYAWYQPIHHFAGQWGVFVREEGIVDIAGGIAHLVETDRDPLMVAADCERMAHVLLRLHEAFHHKVESAAVRLEIAAQAARYRPYDESVFIPLRRAQSDELLEEALGTAWMFDQRKASPQGVGRDVIEGVDAFVRGWIPTLPPAYRRGVEISQSGQFDDLKFRLTGQLDEGVERPTRPDHQWVTFTHLYDPMHNRLSAHYIVVPHGEVPFLPHDATGRELALSARDVGKLLTKDGWRRSETNRGRHPVKYVKPGRPPIPVPSHSGSLATGTLKSIASGAGYRNVHAMLAALR